MPGPLSDLIPNQLGHDVHHDALQALHNTPATTNYQTGDYQPVLADANSVIEIDSASAETVTIPPHATVAFPIGTILVIFQVGAGTVSIAPGAGVTIWSAHNQVGGRDLSGQYAEASLRKRDTNHWVLVGSLA